MKDVFKCKHCENDIFVDVGRIDFANIHFRGLKCVKCENISVLEQKADESDKFLIKFDKNQGKNAIK